MSTNVKPGDWVRFERDGKVVIGVVLYVDSALKKYPYETQAITDVGRVRLTAILERRAAPEAQAKPTLIDCPDNWVRFERRAAPEAQPTRIVCPGDWVRFERDGAIMVGVVQYLDKSTRTIYLEHQEVITNLGRVTLTAILERRAADAQELKP